MRMSSIVIYNFSPPPSVIFSADGAENDYLYLRGRCFCRLRRQKHSPIYNRLLYHKQLQNKSAFCFTIDHVYLSESKNQVYNTLSFISGIIDNTSLLLILCFHTEYDTFGYMFFCILYFILQRKAVPDALSAEKTGSAK